MADVLGKPIVVLAYQIMNSKFDDNNGKCMKLQIEMDGEKRILFTGSQYDGTTKYVQLELQTDPGCRLKQLGFTVDYVEKAIKAAEA